MAIPPQLANVLTEAKTQVRAHPRHELILPIRKKIWSAMGPLVRVGKRATHTVGLYRRTMLAVYATTFVLPIWEQYWPQRDPHHMLEIAEQYIQRKIDFDVAVEEKNLFSGKLHNIQGIPEEQFHSIYVGYASVRAVIVALGDESCEGDGDLDDDRDDWDTSFYACGAFAGELPWEKTSDSKKRLQFWEWYLDDAVPRAYAQAG